MKREIENKRRKCLSLLYVFKTGSYFVITSLIIIRCSSYQRAKFYEVGLGMCRI